MSDENQAAAGTDPVEGTEVRKRAPASNFLPIVRGRLPLLFVHAIRFNPVLTAMGNKDLATKFGTSVGKVFDIKKGRNFSYIGADYKPTAEDVAAAEAWMAQVGAQNAKGLTAAGDKSVMQTTLDEYKAAGLATPEQAAAQASVKAVVRKPKEAKAPATGEKVTGSADDLLS